MLDLGEKKFLKENPKNILITHFHLDHAFFAFDPIKTKIPIYAPEKLEGMKIKILKKKTKIGSYLITPIPVIHSLKVKSQAYLIERGNKKTLYAGDVAWIKKKYHKYFKDLDLVIIEASYYRKGGLILKDKKGRGIYGHTGVPDFIRMFKPYTSKILFVHFGSWFYKNMKKSQKKFEKLAKENDIKILVGYDGMKLKL
jgi:ribonuclease BN (tRNA processing enzyme)